MRTLVGFSHRGVTDGYPDCSEMHEGQPSTRDLACLAQVLSVCTTLWCTDHCAQGYVVLISQTWERLREADGSPQMPTAGKRQSQDVWR